MSFFRAELYWSSERSGSPLGNVSSGDLVAISHTPRTIPQARPNTHGHNPVEIISERTAQLMRSQDCACVNACQ